MPEVKAPEILSKTNTNQPVTGGGFQRFTFPYQDKTTKLRLADYDYHEMLFLGDHYEAFRVRVNNPEFNRAYDKIRYVKVNFAGLISKVIADFLFSEPIQIKVPDGDQDWIDALVDENQLLVQCYESELSNSYFGDALWKIRAGKRWPRDKESTVIIEDTTPKIYFPELDKFNVRQEPEIKELAWVFYQGENKYLRKEIHTPYKIFHKLYLMKGDQAERELEIGSIDPDQVPEEEIPIDKPLLYHVPNWKTGSRYFGISDYYDLDTLFFAINNRISKTDNVLDKHGDPILMVPPGILDEKGKVRKQSLGVIEIGEGENGKPEYVVWDASLENAFKQIEKLVEFMFMISETSPDILGMGHGQSDSGRALKYKLLRTVAKAARKKLYYDRKIKDTIYAAQLLAKAMKLPVGGELLKKEPVYPEIIWADGIPIDYGEQLENEQVAIDSGLTSEEDAMMRVYGYDRKTAETKAKEIRDSKAIMLPSMNVKPTMPPGGGNPPPPPAQK